MKLKKKKRKKIKFTITRKILFIYIMFSILSIILTTLFSYIVFKSLMEGQISNIDLKTTLLKSKFEELYKNDVLELPDLEAKHLPLDEDKSKILFDNIEKEFPGYQFEMEFVEGTLEYKEIPKLVFDNQENKYFFEIRRHIKFEKSLPFRSLQLSLKFNFYEIIFKSIVIGTLISSILLISIMIFISRRFIKPVLDVSKFAKQIAEGSVGITVKHKSTDEIGDLVKSFNHMSYELLKMKKIRNDLLATVSHELRSPLGRIKGYTELLLDIDFKKEEKDLYYKSILQEVDLLNEMAAEIIEISRLEMHKEKLYLETIDMSSFFKMMEDILSITAKIEDVTISYNIEDNLFYDFDVEKMKRVIVNVVNNSIKAKAKNIKITAFKKDGLLQISIVDDGIGIADEYLELVFEKFFRIDKSRDRRTGGFGLGLSICKGIINEHKGEIYFSPCEKGSSLNIDFPLTENTKG